ncbi:MAG TPA: YciI family protein [Bryobacteraceae bacterium]|nr:YciI family protein [Bryobacteraceae bacterium]
MQANQAAPSAYMLIFRESSPETYVAMSAEQRKKLLNQWNAWYDGLAAEGKVKGGHPLRPEGRVVSNERVLDGPYAEGKEAVGGFFFLTVDSLDEATAIAKQCPTLRYGLIAEIRPVADRCAVLSQTEQESSSALVRT